MYVPILSVKYQSISVVVYIALWTQQQKINSTYGVRNSRYTTVLTESGHLSSAISRLFREKLKKRFCTFGGLLGQ